MSLPSESRMLGCLLAVVAALALIAVGVCAGLTVRAVRHGTLPVVHATPR